MSKSIKEIKQEFDNASFEEKEQPVFAASMRKIPVPESRP